MTLMRPQAQRGISGLGCERAKRIEHPVGQTTPSHLRLDEEAPQPCPPVRIGAEKHAAHDRLSPPRHPRAFTCRVASFHEFRDDAGHQRLEGRAIALVARVESPMAHDDPSGISGLKVGKQEVVHRASMDNGAAGRQSTGREAPRMGINDDSEVEAGLQIGPTDRGMVRIFIEANGIEVPMDFEPEEAEEIAEEIRAAAGRARAMKR